MTGFDVYPLNLPVGGAFLEFFVWAALVTLVLSLIVRSVIARRYLDRSPDGAAKDSATLWSVSTGGAYRSAPSPSDDSDRPLAIGIIPRGDELFALAYLRRGVLGVANVLIARALGERLLVPAAKESPSAELRLRSKVEPSSALLRDFKSELRRFGGALDGDSVKQIAEVTAYDHEPALQRALADSRLIRSAHRVRVYMLLVVIPVAFLMFVGLLRCHMLASIDRPYSNLAVAMVVVAIVTVPLAMWGRRRSTLAARYLRWVDDATMSLSSDVERGRSSDPADMSLALAVGGSSILATIAYLAPFLANDRAIDPGMIALGTSSIGTTGFWAQRISAQSPSDSSYVSTCSSSSCGGGGGCGGGGCGGGGGCS